MRSGDEVVDNGTVDMVYKLFIFCFHTHAKFTTKPTCHHNRSLEPRRERQSTEAVQEVAESRFDGEAVVMKDVGGRKAG